MTHLDILMGFETEIGMIDSIDKPATDDSLFWLNQGVDKFVKLRFNGDFVHHTGYEQTEKRREDLIKLYASKYCTINSIRNDVSYNVYTVEYPEDHLYTLNEDVLISDMNDEHKMSTCVFECTADSYMYRITNSLTDFHYRHHRARPLRVRTNGGCELFTDGKYKIVEYTLGYIKKPTEITLENPSSEYEDFNDNVLHEIIKIAAQMYLENIKHERYQTISQEVLTQE